MQGGVPRGWDAGWAVARKQAAGLTPWNNSPQKSSTSYNNLQQKSAIIQTLSFCRLLWEVEKNSKRRTHNPSVRGSSP